MRKLTDQEKREPGRRRPAVKVLETKGREDLDTPLKMARLKQWCENINTARPEAYHAFSWTRRDFMDAV